MNIYINVYKGKAIVRHAIVRIEKGEYAKVYAKDKKRAIKLTNNNDETIDVWANIGDQERW